MTETNTTPSAVTPSSLLLIDSRVSDYQEIVNATKSDVRYIVFNPDEITGSNQFESIQTKIADLGVSAYTSVGLVQHNMRTPQYSMFHNTAADAATIAGVETNDPTLQTWSGVSGFISGLKTTYGIQNFDMMACALYSDPNWKYIIDALTVQTGVTIRASTDDTGAAGLGGDWFLESHTGVNLKGVYFTEAIENYRGVLFWWGSDNFYTSSKRRPIKSYAVGGLQLWGDVSEGGQNNTGVGLTSDIVGICSDQYRYAALKTNGSVVAWGRPGSDADYTASATVVAVPTASLTTGVIDIVKNGIASAAIKSDGSVVIWGRVGAGAENNTGVNLSGVVNVYSGNDSFAALKHNGSVVCWGHTSYGGSTTTPLNVASSLTSGIVSVYSNSGSFAAINISGGVITWGYSTYANTSDVSNNLTSGVVAIYANSYAYAALKNNGSLVNWGDIRYGGANPGSSVSSDVIHVYPNSNPGFSALKTNGSVVGWGAGVSVPSLTNVVTICSNFDGACAALKSDGSVIVWGDAADGGSLTSPVNVASDLSSGVIALYSSYYSFAALKSNGSVVTWGNTSYGGNSSTVASSLISGVVSITSTGNAFAALKSNGSVITWGSSSWGGSNNTSASISSGVVDIFNTGYSFAALKPTSTPSYDLSGSYYLDIDRLNILRSSDYRRSANLVTLNSNVFTLSATRSLQIFNPSLPNNKPLTMIVPDYQTAPYSLTSTITLPTSIVGSNSMLITSEIGERVNISGVGTYVNYGTYVYKVEANGTYTKTTSLTINSISYNLYGGDGVYSSGIALYNPTSTTTTLSSFSVSAKTYGTDTSFNLTDPSSNRAGDFTFSSSNTQVATISGRTVTIVGPGTSVITASQGGSGNFMNADISASLVVAFGNLSSLSSKGFADGPFVIPAPLSNVLTTYGTTWNKLGADIDGEAAGDYSGRSVSVSADGTVVAIGALRNSQTGANRGHVRVYKYTPGKAAVTVQTDASFGPVGWTRLGADIDGEAAYDQSGYSVSLSADGTTVAIGASGNTGPGYVSIYKYTPSKTVAVTNQNDLSFGPIGWNRLGADIDGEAAYDESGTSVSLSADGTVVAIGAWQNDTVNTSDQRGHVRVYKYNPNKTVAQLTDQSLSTFGPAGWNRLGADIDGEAAGDWSGWSVSVSADGTVVAIGAEKNTGSFSYSGHVRVYKYNANKIVAVTDQSLSTFGPVGWDRLGADIDGEEIYNQSGYSVSMSADGTVVAIGTPFNDGTTGSTSDNRGHVRVYKYTPGKAAVTVQTDLSFGPIGWTRLGADIDGEAAGDQSGYYVSLSADGTIVAIGAILNDGTTGSTSDNRGHVRVYRYTPTKTVAVTVQTDASFGPVGWTRIGADIDGEAAGNQSGCSVSLSNDGTTVAIGANLNGGTGVEAGHVRVYKIDSSGNYTYTSGNSAIADICGNIVLPKSIGSTTINVTQAASGANTSKTATAQLTLGYAPTYQTYTIASKNFEDAPFDLVDPSSNSPGAFTFTSSNASVATISGRTVTIVGAGSATITATQAASGDYITSSTTASFTVNPITSITGTFTVPTKVYGTDTSFNLDDPSSNRAVAFTYTSSNTQVATISGRTVTIIGPGVSVITASQGPNFIDVSASLVVAFGNLSSLSSKVITDGPFVIPAPLSNVLTTYGTTWNKLGADIDGEVTNDRSGERGAVSISADGTVVAIGAVYNDGTSGTVDTTDSRGHVRVYKYTPGKAAVTVQTDSSFGPVGWTRLGADIDGEAAGDNSGYMVSLSADGTTVAIGAYYADGSGNLTSDNRGHVRVYKYTPGKGAVTNQNDASFGPIGWTRLGEDIDGEAVNDNVHSVSLSADGTVVAIGSTGNGGGGNRGQVRVYKYTPNKTVAVTNQNDASFGPVGWTRLGVDIYGEATNDESGRSISLSANGTVIAIGAYNNDGSGNAATDNRGHVRVYKYNPNKTVDVSNQSLSTFGPAGWDRLGADIDGESAGDQSGGKIWDSGSVSLSADGTTVAIGAWQNDGSGNLTANSGHVRVYKYNPNKTVDVSNQSLSTFGPAGWDRLGADIDGEATGDQSGISVSLSSDGTIVAIGANQNDGPGASTDNRGHVRIYRYTPSKTLAVTTQTDASFGPIGWTRIGADIDGETAGDAAATVSLSADGTTVAFGSAWNDSTGVAVDTGHVRVYRIDTSGNYTYTIGNSAIADICGNIVLPKSIGSTTINVTQAASGASASKTATAQLMLGYAPTYQTYTVASKTFGDASFDLVDPSSNSTGAFTFTSSNTSVATISGRTVTITGAGSTTITATQAASGDYITSSTTASFTVNPITTVLGALTVPAKVYGTDTSFNLADPTSNSPAAFTYTSGNTQVATISGRTVTIVGPGVSVITASQAAGNYTAASTTESLVVGFGNLSSVSGTMGNPFVIPTPLSNVVTTYGTTWNQLGADIIGKVNGDESGTSLSVSADGTIVAIGARSNTSNRGTVRVYKYNDISWNQLGADINGEASSDYSGQSVSISANGRVVAIGANMNDGSGNLLPDSGHVRIYEFNGSSWVQRGGDIDGEANGDQSGISVSLSEDGSIVAIGAIMNDGSGNALSNSGHVRVYKYNSSKSDPQLTNQSLSTFGPAGWDRLGGDIDGEAVNDQSGFSVSLSVDGTIVAIGAIFNDGTSGTVDTSNNMGHVRVYRYNASKTDPQLTNQGLSTYGPAGWDRMGSDIDGEVAADQNGFSVSLSADGSTVAIGSPLYDASGSNSGRVRVFAWNGTSWGQRGGNINGIALNENLGDSVSLSADGSILSVGSFMKVANYSYNSSTNAWSQIGANIISPTKVAISNALSYSPHVYLDATNPSSYSSGTWTNLGSLSGNVVMTNMGTFDANDNGGSFNFNGTSNYGQLTIASSTLTSLTYVAVVKSSLKTGYASILDFGNDNLLFVTSNNILSVYNPTISSGFTLTAGVWYFLSVTIATNGSAVFYVNGVSVFSTTATALTSRTNTVWGIGSGIPGNELWNGKISALAIYHNKVLTASEIANLYSSYETYKVSLSSQGNIVAIGAREYDGVTGASTNIGATRVYRIDTSGNYTYTSSNPAVADICGNIVLPKSGGSTTITVTQSASGANTSKSATVPLTINLLTPTIGALTAPAKNFRDTSFNLTAPTSTSDGAFTYTSSNTAVATVTSGGNVTIVGTGSTTITATQASTTNYTTGSVSASLVVSPIAPTFGTFTVPGKNFRDASFNLTAPTTDSSGSFTYTIDASESGVATVTSSGVVTIIGAGTATITATQDACGNFTSRDVTASLVVSPIAPTYQSISQITKTYSTDVSFSLTSIVTGVSNSSGAYSFSSASNAIDICGGVATILAYTPSAITITASQGASGNYTASSTTFSLLVNRKTPSYGEFSIPAKTYGDASFSAVQYAPTTDSLSVPFTYTSSDSNVATINSNGSVVTIIGQGYTTITASQEASGNYAANSVTTSFLVNRAAPTFLKAFTIPNKTFGDASFSLLPFTEGLDNTDGTYHFTSSNADLVSISNTDNVTAIIHAYTPIPITIYVAIDACGNYAASSTSGTLNVSRATPTIGALTAPAKNFRDASFNLTAPTTDSSGAFTYTSDSPTVATVTSDGGVVTIVGAGTAIITATQDACGNFTTRAVTASLVVSPIAPTFGTFSAPAKNFRDASFNLTAPTTDSSGAFTYTSDSPTVATVTSSGTVTIVGAGTAIITATQAATTNYNRRIVFASLVVSPIAPTIGTLSTPSKNFGDAAFTLTAPTSDSSGAFTYSIDASGSGVATVTSSGTVTIVGAGTTTITATQEASGNFIGGSVTATLVISEALGNFTIPPKNYGDASFNLTNPSSNDNTVGFTFTSSNAEVATITPGGRTVTIIGAGSSVITATQAATANRGQLDISAVLVVSPIQPVITLASITKTYGDNSFRLEPSSTNTDTSGGILSYSSDNTGIVSIVDTSFVSITGVGSTIIRISQTASKNFTDASKNVAITVNKRTPVLSTFTVNGNKTYGSAPFSIIDRPTSASNGVITYESNNESVATIDNSGIITLVGYGYVNFIATQASVQYYNSATKTSNTMTVYRQSIPLTRVTPSNELIDKIYGDSYFTVAATNASDGAFTYQTDNSNVAGIINASTGVVSILSVGTATITANRAQTSKYTSTPVSWTVQVARSTTTLSGLVDSSHNVTAAPFTVTATSESDGAISYALQDPTSTVLTIHPTSGLVRLKSPGSAVIVASQAQGTLYQATSYIHATITVEEAGNALQGATLTDTTNFSSVNLRRASLANANITNTNFSSANLNSVNFNNSVITSANMANTDISGASLKNAVITGTDFTSAVMRSTDLSGATVRSSIFANADLSGSILTRIDASGSSFVNSNLKGANLSNANLTNANLTNANISGANITDVSFTTVQKLQLLKNEDNRVISQIQVSEAPGSVITSVVSESSTVRSIPNITGETFKIVIPDTSPVSNETITNITLDVANYTYFYLPINENEYFQIDSVKYYVSSGIVRNAATNQVVEVIQHNGKSVWLLAGSIVGLVLQTNTLNTSSFVVPNRALRTNTTPFAPNTLPTSNSDSPIVYSSSNPNIATIHSSTGMITITGNAMGEVRFTATQVQNATYEPGSITSNILIVDRIINFTLAGLNQLIDLTTLASLDASSVNIETTDATSVFYVRLSDMTDLFQYQTDSFDVNDVSSTDIKYYVFNRNLPAEFKINPVHAMMNKTESAGMLGTTDLFSENKMLAKHDFLRYIALRLFNTIHGVDLFSNEFDLLENSTYMGETVRNNIEGILSGISTTSGDESMPYDASGNKYLTNSASGNTNLCRELMRQIAASSPSRFYNNGANDTGRKNIPLRENDTITFKVTFQSAIRQNDLTDVSDIPSRSYLMKLVLKSSVTHDTNVNTAVVDSEMYPNAYPYSSSVTTYGATSGASSVYNVYSPPAPIPFSRFGFNGWYYANTSAWVNVDSSVRNHVKWLVGGNTGSSTIGNLQYIRFNLKIHNKTSLPFLMIYTQSGSMRKYAVLGGSGSLVNGTKYSLYVNFNSYSREPAMIGYTNAAMVYTSGSGTFANNEVITNIALETDFRDSLGSVEFTLASIIVGESVAGVASEKEYGFKGDVPTSYP